MIRRVPPEKFRYSKEPKDHGKYTDRLDQGYTRFVLNSTAP